MNEHTLSQKYSLGPRISQGISSCLHTVYGLVMGIIVLICLFLSTSNFVSPYSQLLPEVLLLAMGLCAVALFLFLCKHLTLQTPHTKGRFLLAVSIIVLACQLIFVRSYYFYTGWDVQTVTSAAESLSHGESTSNWFYFSTYPNNLFIVYIFTVIFQFLHWCGLHTYEYVSLLVLQCILNTLTGALLARILDKLIGDTRLTALGYLLYLGLIAISPWVSIPYSDSLGLVFPILILDIYLSDHKVKHAFWSWLAMTVLAFLGYRLKPQLVILWIAIVLQELVHLLRGVRIKQLAKQLSAILLGVLCTLMLTQAAISSLSIPSNDSLKFQLPHFLMMGMNAEHSGIYNSEDVEFSRSFATVEERNAADLARAKEYLQDMGFTGFIKHMVNKTLVNYNDGTFFWGREGGFYYSIIDREDTALSSLTQGLFFVPDKAPEEYTGSYYGLWLNFAQMLWLAVLFLSIFSSFGPRRDEKDAVMLGILGLTLFELLFEARSRYLFSYVPLYIVLAVCGVHSLWLWYHKKHPLKAGNGTPLPGAQAD